MSSCDDYHLTPTAHTRARAHAHTQAQYINALTVKPQTPPPCTLYSSSSLLHCFSPLSVIRSCSSFSLIYSSSSPLQSHLRPSLSVSLSFFCPTVSLLFLSSLAHRLSLARSLALFLALSFILPHISSTLSLSLSRSFFLISTPLFVLSLSLSLNSAVLYWHERYKSRYCRSKQCRQIRTEVIHLQSTRLSTFILFSPSLPSHHLYSTSSSLSRLHSADSGVELHMNKLINKRTRLHMHY